MSVLTMHPPARRSELVIKPFGNDGQYVVKDPRSGEYFQLDEQSSFLLLALDGTSTLDAIQTDCFERFGIAAHARLSATIRCSVSLFFGIFCDLLRQFRCPPAFYICGDQYQSNQTQRKRIMETSVQTNTKIIAVDSGKPAKNATTGRFRIVKLEERIAPLGGGGPHTIGPGPGPSG